MKLLGILNLTPDSFSDGGQPEASYLTTARQMITDGADIIDIGAESTRPGATTISPETEWQRLEPFLQRATNMNLSIDTRNPSTARQALAYKNVKYLNDVSGFNNTEMLQLAASSGINIIAMHSLTVPADKNITLTIPPVETVQQWIKTKFLQFTKSGISPDKIIFDPGIGFGKTPEQSQQLIINAAALAKTCHQLGTSILYGHSRKSFLGGDVAQRDLETAQISADLQKAGVDYIRVHNIKMNYQELHKQETGN